MKRSSSSPVFGPLMLTCLVLAACGQPEASVPSEATKFNAADRSSQSLKEGSFRQSEDKNNEDNFYGEWLNRYRGFDKEWWFEMIRVPEVFEHLSGRDLNALPDSVLESQAPVIAILDSGVDYEHPALEGKVWQNPNPGTAGCLNDQWGCDTTSEDGDFGQGPGWPFGTSGPGQSCKNESGDTGVQEAACSHGTHIAGLIVGSIKTGVPGLCPMCKVFPIKIVREVDGQGKVPDDAILKALRYIKRLNDLNGGVIRVVNSSFGKFERSLKVQEAVRDLTDSGVLVVAAAGNEGVQNAVYPAAFSDVLSVSAVGSDGSKAWYTNFGPWVDIAAPGGNRRPFQTGPSRLIIMSITPGNSHDMSQGTSVASPLVAGTAGLLMMADPSQTVYQIRDRILRAADRGLYGPAYGDGVNQPWNYRLTDSGEVIPLLGAGLLDVKAAWDKLDRGAHAGKDNDRVQAGCGVIGLNSGDASDAYRLMLSFLFSLPIFLSVLFKRKFL